MATTPGSSSAVAHEAQGRRKCPTHSWLWLAVGFVLVHASAASTNALRKDPLHASLHSFGPGATRQASNGAMGSRRMKNAGAHITWGDPHINGRIGGIAWFSHGLRQCEQGPGGLHGNEPRRRRNR